MLCDWVSRISDKPQKAGALSAPIFNLQKTTGHMALRYPLVCNPDETRLSIRPFS